VVAWGRASTLEELLLQLSLGYLNLDCLVDLLLVAFLVVGVVLDCGREKCVDEGRLSQTGFTSNLNRELNISTVKR
jgi:hypothetical protein